MKYLLSLCMVALIVVGCKKDPETTPAPPPVPLPPHPQMSYMELNNTIVNFGGVKRIDLDGDNSIDIGFSTLLVSSPADAVDKRQYYAGTAFHVSLLVDNNEQTPVLNHGDSIKTQDHRQSHWYNANAALLAQKIMPVNGSEYWSGNWVNTTHKYVAVQVNRNGLPYNGYVELSFDAVAEQIILHKAAICREAGKTVRAGY